MASSKTRGGEPAQPAKSSTKQSPAARGASKADNVDFRAPAAPERSAPCPLAPPGHFALLDDDNQVGDHVLCEVNHSLRIASLSPLKVVPA